jgi:DNA segregation ATPase FtsK/SpoIIIE, S-DNA-T family
MEQDTVKTVGDGKGQVAGYRELQRTALRDLVALARECAAMEAEIEQRYSMTMKEAGEQLEKDRRAAERQFDESARMLSEDLAQREGAIEAEHGSRRSKAEEELESERERILREHEPLQQKIRKEFEHEVWLADSVLESAQNHLRKEAKKAQAQLEEQVAALGELEAEGAGLCERYGQRWNRDEMGGAKGESAAGSPVGLQEHQEGAKDQLTRLKGLQSPRVFVGVMPYLIVAVVVGLAAVVGQWWGGGSANPGVGMWSAPAWGAIGWSAGIALGLLLVGGVVLRVLARRQVREVAGALAQELLGGYGAAEQRRKQIAQTEAQRLAEAQRRRDAEVRAAREKYTPMLTQVVRRREAATQVALQEHEAVRAALDQEHEEARSVAAAARQQAEQELAEQRRAALEEIDARHRRMVEESEKEYRDRRMALERRLDEGLSQIHVEEAASLGVDGSAGGEGRLEVPGSISGAGAAGVGEPVRGGGRPVPLVRIGEMAVDLKRIAASAAGSLARSGEGKPARAAGARSSASPASKGGGSEHGSLTRGERAVRLPLPEPFKVPMALEFPRRASLLVQAQHDGRDKAIGVLQMVMTRLLTTLPPGRVRFTLIDPVGLGQSFAGFMHLADHDESLVGGRIWSETDQISQRLADLTDHMETVIQKYLRNEYETIDEYNAQAGELAEPYRFLVIADFPTGFDDEAVRRLNSVISSGPRCGVYTLMFRDMRQELPAGMRLEELEGQSINLVHEVAWFSWKDEVFGQFPLTLEEAPPEHVLTRMLEQVGQAAKASSRVEVPFETIAPANGQMWSRDSRDELVVPIGRLGATRLQQLRLGRGVAQHALVAGKTGSGKSTLLHVLITNLAMWYHPDEVQFYLVDFKKGVEFKTYATHRLPHARAIAVESDREFGLSVLQRLDGELTRRGELFRRAGVQDLAGYRRQAAGTKMPRLLLIIDEFQEFFSEDDKLAQEAALLLDRLVRQGRAFGIHVLLGSQTIGGTSGLARSTIGQMAVRIALLTSEADSQMILGDNNSAARLLSRPGEAIYNDAGGLVEGNSPFQVAWLSDGKRDDYLARVIERGRALDLAVEVPVVFEGNAPADISENRLLERALRGWGDPDRRLAAPGSGPAWAWVGEPVAIKDPTGIPLRRQSGANVLIVGQNEEPAMAIMAACLVSLASQHGVEAGSFVMLDGTPADSPLAGYLPKVAAALPQEVRQVEWRDVEEVVGELEAEVQRRQSSEGGADRSIYVYIYGLQRYRMLRRSEEEFSFSLEETEKKANAAKQLVNVLREGPPLGIHVVAWADTPAAIDRTFERGVLREFDHRVLFQMSATDSSNLIDSPLANKLGFHRGLLYSEERGVMEKFRPYALPSAEWLEWVGERLREGAGYSKGGASPSPSPSLQGGE